MAKQIVNARIVREYGSARIVLKLERANLYWHVCLQRVTFLLSGFHLLDRRKYLIIFITLLTINCWLL